MPYYRLGSTGAVVEQIQQALKAASFYVGPIDGIFGGNTEASVRRFQSSRQLEADGVVGEQTWKALIPSSDAPPAPLAGKGLD